jgi:hypothetical protein
MDIDDFNPLGCSITSCLSRQAEWRLVTACWDNCRVVTCAGTFYFVLENVLVTSRTEGGHTFPAVPAYSEDGTHWKVLLSQDFTHYSRIIQVLCSPPNHLKQGCLQFCNFRIVASPMVQKWFGAQSAPP